MNSAGFQGKWLSPYLKKCQANQLKHAPEKYPWTFGANLFKGSGDSMHLIDCHADTNANQIWTQKQYDPLTSVVDIQGIISPIKKKKSDWLLAVWSVWSNKTEKITPTLYSA